MKSDNSIALNSLYQSLVSKLKGSLYSMSQNVDTCSMAEFEGLECSSNGLELTEKSNNFAYREILKFMSQILDSKFAYARNQIEFISAKKKLEEINAENRKLQTIKNSIKETNCE